jgi:type II secretory pathway pseudopilin PulG
MGIVRAVDGYMFARDNSSMTQKAQLALSRMTREMVEIQGVTTAAGSSVMFTAPMGAVSDTRTIGLVGTTVKLAEGATALASGDTLVDNVAGFTMTYAKSDGSAWVLGTDAINLLARIDIVLRLTRQDVGAVTWNSQRRLIQGIRGISTPRSVNGNAKEQTMSFLNRIKRRGASKRRPVGNRSGFILVGLVLTMIVMAILAAAILPMFSSATLNEVSANLDHKAYYMAESGLRYVASRYLHDATGEARDDTLAALNGKTFSLNGQYGGFSLGIESFFYKTDSGSSGPPFGTVPKEIVTAATASGTTGKLAVYNSTALNYNITTCTGYTVATDRSGIGFTGAALTPLNGRIFPMASLTTTVTSQPMPATLVLGAADDLASSRPEEALSGS